MDNQKLTFKEKEIDTAEFIEEVHALPYEHREKIYYMIQGYKLLSKVEEEKEPA